MKSSLLKISQFHPCKITLFSVMIHLTQVSRNYTFAFKEYTQNYK